MGEKAAGGELSYGRKEYIRDVTTLGIKKTWPRLCRSMLEGGAEAPFVRSADLGELYEVGLAIENKQLKKDSGQYYTPDDVAGVMARWLLKLEGDAVCDVGCGTGKLILTYLDLLGRERARELIAGGGVYLYDLDAVALQICESAILWTYGADLKDRIHLISGDFLDQKVHLPTNCKVIANPPYASMKQVEKSWARTAVVNLTREYYAAFMEKIALQCRSMVIITPYSFISGSRFYPLREVLNGKTGEIYSFDNVPGNIFCGRKHGVFNTNTSNSVRAAITVVRSGETDKGFRLTPLIRFKQTERRELLTCENLESRLSPQRQLVSPQEPMYCKCGGELLPVYRAWREKSAGKTIGDYITADGAYPLFMPNTCRYFTAASNHPLNRSGQIGVAFDDEDVFNFIYCLVNSSFVYWYWRMYDGGISYPKGLFYQVPVFFDALSREDKAFFAQTTARMTAEADRFLVTKSNLGVQENLKYPGEYRDAINARLLSILGLDLDVRVFDQVHSNTALRVEKRDENMGKKLSQAQKELMKIFYSSGKMQVVYSKDRRDGFWRQAARGPLYSLPLTELEKKCPAMAHQIKKSFDARGKKTRNIQSAVFSECAYAQTLANLLGLTAFLNCLEEGTGALPWEARRLLDERGMTPRYVYASGDRATLLVQAGGNGGVDCALIRMPERKFYAIEFKEPGSKGCELDLPLYGEDGKLPHPIQGKQYEAFQGMLREKKELNFFLAAGKNVHGFSAESVSVVVEENYIKNKHADVICTEDKDGCLVMLPVSHISDWIDVKGEIRPAGRNPLQVWTPKALRRLLAKKGARIQDGEVTIPKDALDSRKPRGGGSISGYKITPLFFVRLEHCKERGDQVTFPLNKVRQLKPTIAVIINFKDLKYDEVVRRYRDRP